MQDLKCLLHDWLRTDQGFQNQKFPVKLYFMGYAQYGRNSLWINIVFCYCDSYLSVFVLLVFIETVSLCPVTAIFGFWEAYCSVCWHCISKNYLSHLVTKPTKWHVRPAKTQISMGIRPFWSKSSLCAEWVVKDPSFLHGDSEDSDQTGRLSRLIWVFAGPTCHFVCFVTRWLISFYQLTVLLVACKMDMTQIPVRNWSF